LHLALEPQHCASVSDLQGDRLGYRFNQRAGNGVAGKRAPWNPVQVNRLLLATRNAHKTREFSEILGNEFDVRDLSAEPDVPEIEETGATFAENAILKAVAISKRFPGMVIGDDSGLEVDALEGAPGVYSARYAGPDAKDRDNIARLLSELRKLSIERPCRARFRCVLALVRDGKLVDTFAGAVEGTIVELPRGTGGFGYDPVFQPTGLAQTFGEIAPEKKNRISHRANAIRLLRAALCE
jgi:XTP/dITP diphosphohydrolase